MEKKLYRITDLQNLPLTASDYEDLTPVMAQPGATDPVRWASMSRIAVNPADEFEFWVTFWDYWDNPSGSGLGWNRVIHYQSTDNGATWTENDYSTGLPQFPANCIVCQKNSNGILYCGTDVGVYYRDASMPQWECYSENLPVVIITDLEINDCKGTLKASTYGRAIWETPLVVATQIATTNTWTNPVFLNYDLVIPSGVTLTIKTDVNIAKGRKITIQPGGILDISTNAHLFNGCNEMWDKIDVDGPSALLKVRNGAIIEDAINASYTANGGVIQIDNGADYRDNYNHLHIEGVTNPLYIGHVSKSTFECPNNLQDPTVGTRTVNAIEIKNSLNVTIGDQSGIGLANTIKEFIRYGIQVQNSDGTVINNDISSLISASTTGVFANNLAGGGRLVYVGTTSGGSNSNSVNFFHDLNRGVYVINGITPIVYVNDFSKIAYKAIFASQCYKQISITSNNIHNSSSIYIGIHTINNPKTSSISIVGNVENLHADAIGIKDEEPVLMDFPLVRIISNQIFTVRRGIWVVADANPLIMGNRIEFNIIPPNSQNGLGIFVQNSYRPDIEQQNYIYSTTTHVPFRGIVVETSTAPYICSNVTDKLERGIICRGQMFGTKVKLNMMSNCDNGFVLSNHGNIGPQGDGTTGDVSDNQWYGNGCDSYSVGLSNLLAPTTEFFVNGLPGYNIINACNLPGSVQVFSTPLSSSFPADCADHSGWRPQQRLIETISDTTENDSTLTYEEKWIGDKATYEFAIGDTSIDTTVQVIESYLDAMETHPIGQFHEVETDVSAAFADTVTFTTDTTKIEEAGARNDQVDNSRLIDSYKRIAMEIYLSTLARDNYEFNEDQENWIRFVAPLCPFEAGPAVYTMRVMHYYLDEYAQFNDDDCDENAAYRKAGDHKNDSGTGVSQFIVYPNPASNELNIDYIINKESNSLFELTDIAGKKIFSEILKGSEHHVTLKTDKWKAGTYFYSIYFKNDRIKNDRLIIIK